MFVSTEHNLSKSLLIDALINVKKMDYILATISNSSIPGHKEVLKKYFENI